MKKTIHTLLHCLLAAAVFLSLTAGAYSVKLTGANGGTGEGLIEIYEVWP